MNLKSDLSKQTRQEEHDGAAKPKQRAPGFLPIKTNMFDRFFISAVCLVAIHLFWLRALEATFPLWVATVISLALSYVIVRYG